MLYTAHQVVSGRKIFTNNLTVPRHANVRTSNFSGVSLGELYLDAVTLKGNQVIAGEKKCSSFSVLWLDVHVTGTVQGIDVSEEVVDASKNVTVSGRKFMKKGFNVDGNMWVSGLVDSVKVEELCQKSANYIRQPICCSDDSVGRRYFPQGSEG
ncbi:hypothetical protein MRX96_022777 [Rhipicephalus microplus]